MSTEISPDRIERTQFLVVCDARDCTFELSKTIAYEPGGGELPNKIDDLMVTAMQRHIELYPGCSGSLDLSRVK